jgi:hypothetical protein
MFARTRSWLVTVCSRPDAKAGLLILPASMIVCADGGANELHKILQENKQLWHRGVSQSAHDLIAYASSEGLVRHGLHSYFLDPVP